MRSWVGNESTKKRHSISSPSDLEFVTATFRNPQRKDDEEDEGADAENIHASNKKPFRMRVSTPGSAMEELAQNNDCEGARAAQA